MHHLLLYIDDNCIRERQRSVYVFLIFFNFKDNSSSKLIKNNNILLTLKHYYFLATPLLLSLFLVKLIHTPHFLSLYFYFILLERVGLYNFYATQTIKSHTPHFLSLYFYFILLERVCLYNFYATQTIKSLVRSWINQFDPIFKIIS